MAVRWREYFTRTDNEHIETKEKNRQESCNDFTNIYEFVMLQLSQTFKTIMKFRVHTH
jgi:hypothetical protein